MISETTYKWHATEYLQPTIYNVWHHEQEHLFCELAHIDLRLLHTGGDGRAGSRWLSAKFGSYTVMELRLNKISVC